MKFAAPALLLLILPVTLVFLSACLYAARTRRRHLIRLLGEDFNREAVLLSSGKRRLRGALLLGCMLCLIAGLARPYRSAVSIERTSPGRDIMIVFDVSRSMMTPDVAPNRLEHARYLCRRLLERKSADRFGLVVFAGTAYLICPLTSDRVSLGQYLNDMDTTLVPVGGTNLEAALQVALNALESVSADSPAILLLTDGNELTGDSARVVRELKKKKIPVLIAGLGEPDLHTPMPYGDGDFIRTADGSLAYSRLHESGLRRLAEATGGLFIHSTALRPGLPVLNHRIEQMAADSTKTETISIPKEDFMWPFGLAFLLLLLWFAINERAKAEQVRPPGRVTRALLPVVLLGALSGFAGEGAPISPPLAQGIPDAPNAVAMYNSARLMQLHQMSGAQARYEEALLCNADPELESRIVHNLGALHHAEADATLQQARDGLDRRNRAFALQKVTLALELYDRAEALYAAGLALSGSDIISTNVKALARSRREAETLQAALADLDLSLPEEVASRQEIQNHVQDEPLEPEPAVSEELPDDDNPPHSGESTSAGDYGPRQTSPSADVTADRSAIDHLLRRMEEESKARHSKFGRPRGTTPAPSGDKDW